MTKNNSYANILLIRKQYYNLFYFTYNVHQCVVRIETQNI